MFQVVFPACNRAGIVCFLGSCSLSYCLLQKQAEAALLLTGHVGGVLSQVCKWRSHHDTHLDYSEGASPSYQPMAATRKSKRKPPS